MKAENLRKLSSLNHSCNIKKKKRILPFFIFLNNEFTKNVKKKEKWKNKNPHKTKLVKCELFWYPITSWKDIICVRFYLGRGTLFHSFKKKNISYNIFHSQGEAFLLFRNIINIETYVTACRKIKSHRGPVLNFCWWIN